MVFLMEGFTREVKCNAAYLYSWANMLFFEMDLLKCKREEFNCQ